MLYFVQTCVTYRGKKCRTNAQNWVLVSCTAYFMILLYVDFAIYHRGTASSYVLVLLHAMILCTEYQVTTTKK